MDSESKNSANLATLYLARHGETEWNVAHLMQGQKDSPLTANGVKQAEELREELKEINFDAVYSSDSFRARKTAEVIRLEDKLAITTMDLLREKYLGRWEGRKWEEYQEEINKLFGEMENLPDEEKWSMKLDCEMESNQELIARFITAIREISAANPGKKVLVVTHGGCLRTFLVRLGWAKFNELPAGSFKNAGYVKIKSDGVDFFLEEVKGVMKKEIPN